MKAHFADGIVPEHIAKAASQRAADTIVEEMDSADR